MTTGEVMLWGVALVVTVGFALGIALAYYSVVGFKWKATLLAKQGPENTTYLTVGCSVKHVEKPVRRWLDEQGASPIKG